MRKSETTRKYVGVTQRSKINWKNRKKYKTLTLAVSGILEYCSTHTKLFNWTHFGLPHIIKFNYIEVFHCALFSFCSNDERASFYGKGFFESKFEEEMLRFLLPFYIKIDIHSRQKSFALQIFYSIRSNYFILFNRIFQSFYLRYIWGFFAFFSLNTMKSFAQSLWQENPIPNRIFAKNTFFHSKRQGIKSFLYG